MRGGHNNICGTVQGGWQQKEMERGGGWERRDPEGLYIKGEEMRTKFEEDEMKEETKIIIKGGRKGEGEEDEDAQGRKVRKGEPSKTEGDEQ